MARKMESIVKSFSNSLTENDLHFFCSRLHWRYQDDLQQAFDYISELKHNNMLEHADVDYVLHNVKSSEEFHRNLDLLTNSCLKEYEKRGHKLEQLA